MDATWNRDKMKQTNRNIRLENHTDTTTGEASCGEQNWTDMDQGLTAGFVGTVAKLRGGRKQSFENLDGKTRHIH
jgi:hypothetical protein